MQKWCDGPDRSLLVGRNVVRLASSRGEGSLSRKATPRTPTSDAIPRCWTRKAATFDEVGKKRLGGLRRTVPQLSIKVRCGPLRSAQGGRRGGDGFRPGEIEHGVDVL